MDSIEIKRATTIRLILVHILGNEQRSRETKVSPRLDSEDFLRKRRTSTPESFRKSKEEETVDPINHRSLFSSSSLPSSTPKTEDLKTTKRKQFNISDTAKIWQSVFGNTMVGVCKLCNETQLNFGTRTGENAWEISHIIPYRDQGSDDLDNLRPLCRSCNRSMGKNDFMSYAFRRYTERYEEIIQAFKLNKPQDPQYSDT
jgi:5-methylcytosine-specific restriction endonuclease McrA